MAIIVQGLFTQAQENIMYDFNIQYDMRLNFYSYCTYNANLYFNKTQSLFQYQETSFIKEITEEEINQKFNESDNVSINIRSKDTTQYYTKYDRDKNTFLELAQGFNKNEFFIIGEPAPEVNWILTEENLRIGNYNCTKANCSFRGRNYYAWFTTEIQTSFGPLKLNGLPGLILELGDETKEVMLFVKSIKKVNNSIPTSSDNLKIISRADYLKLKAEGKKRIEEMLNQISSKSERGLTITAKSVSIKGIEME